MLLLQEEIEVLCQQRDRAMLSTGYAWKREVNRQFMRSRAARYRQGMRAGVDRLCVETIELSTGYAWKKLDRLCVEKGKQEDPRIDNLCASAEEHIDNLCVDFSKACLEIEMHYKQGKICSEKANSGLNR